MTGCPIPHSAGGGRHTKELDGTTIMHTLPMNSSSNEPWYRHRWPWLLMLGPVAVLIAGAITMWISFSGADALVVDDYYKQGKAINQNLQRDRVAAELGLTASLRYDAAAGKLRGQVSGLGQAVPLTLLLVHPTVPEKDTRRAVMPNAAGEFEIPLALLERANWQVELEDGQRQWRLHGQWLWPQNKNVDIRPQSQDAAGR